MAIDTAIEILTLILATMRKYHKIVKIVKAWNGMNSFGSMLQISELIKSESEEK